MNTPETVPTLHFPVRRDGWDAVEYFLWLGFLIPAAALSLLWDIHDSVNGESSWFPSGVSIMWTLVFAYGAGVTVWKLLAEQYVMTADALIFEYGYRRICVPYEEIAGLHPMKVCRATTALKPAHRINFRTPIGLDRAADAYPRDDAKFLDELAARCPQLEREGERMHLRIAADATTKS